MPGKVKRPGEELLMIEARTVRASKDGPRRARPAGRAHRYALLESLPVGPSLHVVQTEGWLLVRLDLSGLVDRDLEVSCSETVLTVRGRMAGGPFCRKLPLPEGARAKQAAASLHGGVLRIDIPVHAPALGQGRARSVA